VRNNAENWCDAYPTHQKTAGLLLSVCKLNEPMAELTLNFDPTGSALRLFLKALLRIRIATITELRSFGELTKESFLVLVTRRHDLLRHL
jgi:hypothetical protein